jgi:C4-dicarboxylate-specific signal transduction histidine kinase
MFDQLKALYVEDEEEIKSVVVTVIGNSFKEFATVSNGQEGLDYFLENNDIDLIITDINMPKMDGLSMCQRIREHDKKIPIIITTAYSDRDFLQKAIEVGVSDFVTKPMNMKVLLKSIKKCVEPILLQQKLDEEMILHEQERLQSAKFAAIGQLAAGITHEINTPLTYIKGSFELMEYSIENLPDSKDKENLLRDEKRILDGLIRIENIVNSMKEMSQQTKVEKEKSNIYATVVTSAILAYNKVKHISDIYINGVVFDLSMPNDKEQYIVNIQKQRMEQVWVIIINNAIDELMKIDEFHKRRLDINISQDEKEIKVLFKDNAGGISPSMIDCIFEPFKGSKESSGMGVGLSIAKKIVDDQGASIKAYNEDEGAVFEVCIPLDL